MNNKKIVVRLNYAKLLMSEKTYSSTTNKIIRKMYAGENIIILSEMVDGWYKILDKHNNIGFLNTEFPNILFCEL